MTLFFYSICKKNKSTFLILLSHPSDFILPFYNNFHIRFGPEAEIKQRKIIIKADLIILLILVTLLYFI
jgi:hypothetical protein